MGVVSTAELVAAAVAGGRAVAAFNVVTLEHIEAVIAGAEAAGSPVILAVSENAVAFHGGRLLPIARAAAASAQLAQVAVSLHLDHVTDTALLHRSADAGFSSAMFDAGALDYAANVAATRRAAAWARSAGVWLEAELGYVGGKASASSAHAPGVRTDPAEARAYVAATEVDALAVAVGSSHAMTTRSASLDHELIAALRSAVGVPLVLHGSSGVSVTELERAVRAGMTKINVGTALGIAFTGAVRTVLDADPAVVDPRRYLAPARDAMAATVRGYLETAPFSTRRTE